MQVANDFSVVQKNFTNPLTWAGVEINYSASRGTYCCATVGRQSLD
jgi:hypothetical protein